MCLVWFSTLPHLDGKTTEASAGRWKRPGRKCAAITPETIHTGYNPKPFPWPIRAYTSGPVTCRKASPTTDCSSLSTHSSTLASFWLICWVCSSFLSGSFWVPAQTSPSQGDHLKNTQHIPTPNMSHLNCPALFLHSTHHYLTFISIFLFCLYPLEYKLPEDRDAQELEEFLPHNRCSVHIC